MRHLKLTIFLLPLAGLVLGLSACDTPTQRSAPSEPRSDRARAEQREPIEPLETITVERQRFPADARDPFTPPAAEVATQGARAFEVVECDPATEPLGFSTPGSLRLIGLITGTAVPRALIVASGLDMAVLANEGDRVGPRCSQRIVEIRDNEVIVAPFGADDDPRQHTIIMLREEGIDAVISETN